MLLSRQTISFTPYFQFQKRFDLLFIFVINTHDDLLYLPSCHRGKQRKLSWKSHRIVLCDFCGNPTGDDELSVLAMNFSHCYLLCWAGCVCVVRLP